MGALEILFIIIIIIILAHKTELYANSFIPSTTQLWNTLPETVQAYPSISLLNFVVVVVVNEWHYGSYILLFGSRKEQVKHCRLRLAITVLAT